MVKSPCSYGYPVVYHQLPGREDGVSRGPRGPRGLRGALGGDGQRGGAGGGAESKRARARCGAETW